MCFFKAFVTGNEGFEEPLKRRLYWVESPNTSELDKMDWARTFFASKTSGGTDFLEIRSFNTFQGNYIAASAEYHFSTMKIPMQGLVC